MPLKIDFKKIRYDRSRNAVVFPASDGDATVTGLVTAQALNDRMGTSVEGEAVLVIFVNYVEEIERLIDMSYQLGEFTADGEIWLTTREFYR